MDHIDNSQSSTLKFISIIPHKLQYFQCREGRGGEDRWPTCNTLIQILQCLFVETRALKGLNLIAQAPSAIFFSCEKV